MTEKNKSSWDLVNAIGDYVKENGLVAQDIIFACETVKATVMDGVVKVLRK